MKPLGGSGQTQSTEEEYSIALFAEDLYELLQALKIDSAFLVGCSMGVGSPWSWPSNTPRWPKLSFWPTAGLAGRGLPKRWNAFELCWSSCKEGDVATIAEEMTTGAF